MSTSKRALSTAATVAAGLAIVGGAAVANAATNTPTPSPTGGYSAPGYGTGDQNQQGQQGQQRQAPQHTTVTGDEATKVGDAVKAKDSAVTVTSVRKDPDGSYDVLGTKNGANVMFDVSGDLATITQAQGGPGGQDGQGRGGHQRGQQGEQNQTQPSTGSTTQG